MKRSGKISICFTDAGGGHRATALALREILNRTTGYHVTLVNPYRELIPDVDLFPRFTGYSDEEVYNRFVLGKGWSNIFCLLYYGFTLLNIKLGTRASVKRFLEYWRRESPDLVVSVMPLANQGLYRSLYAYAGTSPVPFVVLITDLEERMKHTWFPRQQDYYIICGSKQSCEQAVNKPHPKELVFCTSGLPVHPAFYDTLPANPAAERMKLGLRPDLPTGCIMYGSAGSKRMEEIARFLQGMDRKCQIVFLCGNNQSLANNLARLRLSYPHVIQGYTTNVPHFFAISDFLISKPGPGTISEAAATGISLLADCRNMLPQERYNLEWIRQNRLGRPFGNMIDFGRVLREMLDAGPDRARAPRAMKGKNRAIFEISGIIQDILKRSGPG